MGYSEVRRQVTSEREEHGSVHADDEIDEVHCWPISIDLSEKRIEKMILWPMPHCVCYSVSMAQLCRSLLRLPKD